MRERKAMGRPREFDTDAALERIMSVFWAKGFEGASMADLVHATGLKKGSLYAAFGDKRAMYHQSLALYDRPHIDAAATPPSTRRPSIRRLKSWCKPASAASKPRLPRRSPKTGTVRPPARAVRPGI